LNHRHRKVLHALFAHPTSANIDVKDVETMFQELGAAVETMSGNRFGITLNGHTVAFHGAAHGLAKDEVVRIRHFLTQCGVDPTAYPA